MMTLSNTLGISVPCLWPGCQQKIIGMWELGRHIRTRHNVTGGFGCPHCGFKHSSREVACSHISIQHQEQADPPTAVLGLAHDYCVPFSPFLVGIEVPQCGATLDELVAIDLHLEAHGGINLVEWYCGD